MGKGGRGGKKMKERGRNKNQCESFIMPSFIGRPTCSSLIKSYKLMSMI